MAQSLVVTKVRFEVLSFLTKTGQIAASLLYRAVVLTMRPLKVSRLMEIPKALCLFPVLVRC